MPRTPDALLADFDKGIKGQADIDMYDVLWEILDDVRSSYRLAMKMHDFHDDYVEDVDKTVFDYIVNHYGEE